MNDFTIQRYYDLTRNTFEIFSVYHLKALDSLLEESINSKDINILNFIHKTKEPISSDYIVEIFYIAKNALSNRLSLFEEKGLIKRFPSLEDKRKTIIQIEPRGIDLLQVYFDYSAVLIKKIRQEMGPLKLLSLKTVIDKLNTHMNDVLSANLFTSISFDFKELNESFLFKVNYFFSQFDYALIQSSKITIKIDELLVIADLYLQGLRGSFNLIELSDKHLIPYQTLISKINRLKKQKLIEKREHSYVFSPEFSHLIESFIYQRIITFMSTFEILSEKEQKITLEIFNILKVHALTYIQKKALNLK
jgi:DNA-binding MarR family transcriptional regulator